MLNYALNALNLGFCVMPATEDGSKQPLGNSTTDRRWKQYQTTLPTKAKVEEWYNSNNLENIGFICGKVSHNLEAIDFDDADAYHEYKTAAASCGLGELVNKIEAGYLEHTPKGVHWYYRCDEISGNLKLASREKRPDEKTHERDKIQVMIETRGEGGFIIAAPSRGKVNPKGEYKLIAGSLATIPTITPEERKELHYLAMSFDRLPRVLEYAEVNNFGTTPDGKRPGDDFAEQTTWEQILEPHGWKRCFSNKAESFWTRPGKQHGISATSNYAGSNLFYVFSSSTEFEPNRGFSKFAVFTYLNHHGDFEAAARALGEDGYGSKPEDAFAENRPLNFQKKDKPKQQEKSIDTNTIPAKLMDIPGLINDLQDFFNNRAIRRQPNFAFAASLAFAGLLLGRRVQTQTGLRTNLLIIALGDSASGKNEARNCIRRALAESGNKDMIGSETIGSESGLLDELYNQGGHCIYQLDEIGYALTAMTNKKAAGYLAAIIPALMKLQSCAGHTWIGKSLKKGMDGQGRKDIEDPVVVVYATSVPDKYYQAINYSNIEDGFIPRFLTFETNDPFPDVQYNRKSGQTPDNILEHIQNWTHSEKRGMIRRPEAGDARTVRHTPETLTAMRHFEVLVKEAYYQYREARLHAIWGRAQATADQLGLLFTCSQNPEAEFLDPLMVAKACMLTKHLCEQQMIRLNANVASTEYETDVKEVIKYINGTRSAGTTRTKLLIRFQGLGSKRLSEIVTLLAESEQIKIIKTKLEGSQKASTVYYDAAFLPEL